MTRKEFTEATRRVIDLPEALRTLAEIMLVAAAVLERRFSRPKGDQR